MSTHGKKGVVNWSGGKDSALALYRLMQTGDAHISCLLTTINEAFDRVSMHGVRTELLDRQARNIGIPLVKVKLPEMPDMPTYEKIMKESLLKLVEEGIKTAVFGDIFLEDLRKYREDILAELDIACLFPLWRIPTHKLIGEFIDLGFKAVTVCVDERFLDRSFVGRVIDHAFVNGLPSNVDPCGENGEFHSFVYDGPIFRKPVTFRLGEVVHRRYSRQRQTSVTEGEAGNNTPDPFDAGFWYCDLLPVDAPGPL